MSQLLLRPRVLHSLPFLLLVAAADIGALSLAGIFLTVRDSTAAAVMFTAAVVTGGFTWAYFARASLGIDGDMVVKTSALGTTSKCPIEDLARIETGYAPQPTVRFIRRDGSLAFRVNARLWSSDQLDALRNGLGLNRG